MFKPENVPVRIEGMGLKREKLGNGEEHKAVKLRLSVDLTPALAADIPGAKSKVFKLNDGTPNDDIESIAFSYVSKAMRVEIRQDPSLGPSVTMRDVQCRRFKVPKRQMGNAVLMKFDAVVLDITPGDLSALKESIFEQRFLTFERMQGGFLEEAEAEERRESKDAAPVKRGRRKRDEDEPVEETGEPAVATH